MVVRPGRGIWLLLLRLGDSREDKVRKGEERAVSRRGGG